MTLFANTLQDCKLFDLAEDFERRLLEESDKGPCAGRYAIAPSLFFSLFAKSGKLVRVYLTNMITENYSSWESLAAFVA